MLRRSLRVLTLILGIAVVLSTALAPTGGAAPKPKATDSVTCSLTAGTTFTWAAGTTLITYEFDRSDGTATAQGTITPVRTNKAGSETIATPSDAAQVQATWFSKSIGGKKPPVACT